jgi:beta-glucanase (GH16 family)
MKKLVCALAALLAATVALTAPAQARDTRVTLQVRGVTYAGHAVLVHGQVPTGVGRVRLERRVGGHWKLLRRVSVNAGAYRTRIALTRGVARLRAQAGTFTSAIQSFDVVVPPSDGCGVRPVKADGTLWSCSFDDEFSGTALDRTKWVPQTDFGSGTAAAHACNVDSPSVIDVSGGTLNLSIRKVATPVSCAKEPSGPTNYIAGGVMTYGLFSQQYGRFEARIRTAATLYRGLQETFWLWPDLYSTLTTGSAFVPGEIDVAEFYSQYPTLVIPFLHYGYSLPIPGVNTAWNCSAARGVFNTYTLTWGPSRIEIQVNGRTCLVNTAASAAYKQKYMMVLTALLGVGANAYDGRAPIPETMNVDYVRAWK